MLHCLEACLKATLPSWPPMQANEHDAATHDDRRDGQGIEACFSEIDISQRICKALFGPI